jgi:hypothetical protein
MQSLDFHHIQNPSALRSRVMQEILDRQTQNIRVIVCSGKLMQQNDLPVCRLSSPIGHDLVSGDPLQQFVLGRTVHCFFIMTS